MLLAAMVEGSINTMPTANVKLRTALHERSDHSLSIDRTAGIRGTSVSTIQCTEMMIGMAHGACDEYNRARESHDSRHFNGDEHEHSPRWRHHCRSVASAPTLRVVMLRAFLRAGLS